MMRVLSTSCVLVLVLVLGLAAQSATRDASWRPKTGPRPSLVPPGTPTPGAAETTAIADVLAFEKATEAAVVRGDTAALERALAPTFLFTHGDGWVDGGPPLKVDTKASWIDYVRKQPAPYIYRELDSVQVELHGDVAITVGRYFYLPQSNGAPQSFAGVVRARIRQAQRPVAAALASHREGPASDPGGHDQSGP